jgi:hypothetical protein
MPVGPQIIEVARGETVVKRLSPPESTSVVGMTWRLQIGADGSDFGDAGSRSRTSGDGLSINTATGDVDWTIDTTDTADATDPGGKGKPWELERTNAGAVRRVAFGYLVVQPDLTG